MPPRIRVRSLAKINLDLRVLHQRPDGYHELRTIFQTISLADTLEIEYRRGPTRIEIKSNLSIPGNIVEKAAHLILEATGKTGRVRVRFREKHPARRRPRRRIHQCSRGPAGLASAARETARARKIDGAGFRVGKRCTVLLVGRHGFGIGPRNGVVPTSGAPIAAAGARHRPGNPLLHGRSLPRAGA